MSGKLLFVAEAPTS